MEITTDRKQLAAAVTWAQKGIGSYVRVPILAGIRLHVEGDTVTVSGFDYETLASVKVQGSDASPGDILVNGKDLAAAVRATPNVKGQAVTLSTRDDVLTVTSGGTTARMSLLPMEEYPEAPVFEPAFTGHADTTELAGAVARVAVSAGTDDTLPVLTCVNLTFTPGTVRLAATDRYRLAAEDAGWAGDTDRSMNIPAKILCAFLKAAGKDGKITLSAAPTADERAPGFGGSGGHVTLTDGTVSLTVREDLGSFPKIERFFTSHNPDASATVDAPALRQAVARAGKQTERNARVTLAFTPDTAVTACGVTVTAERDGQVSYRETVPCPEAGAVTAGYNPEYLAGILAAFPGEAWLTWERGDKTEPTKPLVITGPDTSHAVMLMGIRNSNES